MFLFRIGKSSGYKSGELSTLKEDETLFVGGKEIQVIHSLTQHPYKNAYSWIIYSLLIVRKTFSCLYYFII